MNDSANPYVGPRPFKEGEGHLFFGREKDARDLASLIVAHSEVLLYAQSGAGKTSLLNAKIIPSLRQKGFELLPIARIRLATGVPSDLHTNNVYIRNVLLAWTTVDLSSEKLSRLSLPQFLAERPYMLDEDGLRRPRALIIDQFEELFTLYPDRWKERAGFFEQVGEALHTDSLLRLVFVIREDFLAEFDSYSELLPGNARARVRLERLREKSALEAVIGPLKGTDRAFAPEVAEQLVEQLRSLPVRGPKGLMTTVVGEFVEPAQLQAVCQRLWQETPTDAQLITREHLQEFGDIREVLIDFYERSLRRARTTGRISEGKLRRWFEKVLISGEGTRGTVSRGETHTGGIPNNIVDVLEEEHLLRGEWRGDAHWYELSHDRFIEAILSSNQSRRLRQYRRALALTCGLVISISILFLSSLLREHKVNNVETGWGLPGDFAEYGAQLSHLSVVCMVDNLQLLPRNLYSLNANCERITSLGGIPPRLQYLNVSDSRIEDLHNLPSSVVDLNISGTLVSRVDELNGIVKLDASGIRILNMKLIPRSVKKLKLQHPDIENLEGLPGGLLELEISGTSIHSLKGLPSDLKSLTLRGNSLLAIDFLPPHLEKLDTDNLLEDVTIPRSLRSLALRNSFLRRIPDVKELELANTHIMGDFPARLETLKIDDISSSIPLDELPRYLRSLRIPWPKGESFDILPKSLRNLDLSGSEDLSSIAGLNSSEFNITDLDISRTAIHDLKDVPGSVRELYFEYCDAARLSKIPRNLSRLHLGGCNRLTSIGQLPATLSELHLQGVPIASIGGIPADMLNLDISNTNILGHLPSLPVGLRELTLHMGQIQSLKGLPPSLRSLIFVYPENKGEMNNGRDKDRAPN
jgi:hypothetical protein